MWKRCQGDQLHTLHGHSNGVYAVAFSRDGKRLASGDYAGKVILWDAASRRPLATFVTSATSAKIIRLSFSADGQALASADEVGEVKVWNLATRKAIWTYQGKNPCFMSRSRPMAGRWPPVVMTAP